MNKNTIALMNDIVCIPNDGKLYKILKKYIFHRT